MTGGISFFRNNPFPLPAPAKDEASPPPRGPMEHLDVPAWSSIIPIFGPCHPGWEGHPAGWQFPDTANTSSTENLYLSRGYKPIALAEWIVVWQPSSEAQWARFISMPTRIEDGYGTWTEICKVQGLKDENGWGPRSFRFDATEWLRQARAAAKDLYLGFQVMGDGNAIMLLWKSRLHILHED